ncbi:MAG: helix-hairpin-helix domain-containing protein, partial [Candidatus Promineifilaceae bacterium]|nr:helix-hairpin-helix domain-containing protein [Candidatus Promineifilaceae bacterium]
MESKREWNRMTLFALPSALLLGVAVGFVISGLMGREQPTPLIIEAAPPTTTPMPTATPTATPTRGPVRVYISGAISESAVYELPPGSIVADLVEAAGSFSEDAARDAVNLALPVADGMHVHIPSLEEVDTESAPPLISAPTPSTPGGGTGSAHSEEEAAGGRVNLNTATLAELDTLPGVGPATAQKIVDYREAYGPFERIEDVMNVSGIGEAKFE